jgi:hypothetical protein
MEYLLTVCGLQKHNGVSRAFIIGHHDNRDGAGYLNRLRMAARGKTATIL